MSYASNNNAVLIDSCKSLQNLSVLLEVTEDIATTDGNGWSLQLQCYPPPGEYCQTSQLTVLQYMVIVQGGSLAYYIQYWANGSSTWPSGYTPIGGTSPWLPCWSHDYGNAPTFASISLTPVVKRAQSTTWTGAEYIHNACMQLVMDRSARDRYNDTERLNAA
jgi:hypothetical protein